MLNLYNFMDGIDGLAGGEAAVASSFFFLVFAWYGQFGWAVANLVVAAASMGFLVHNWPPARIFMGDFILDKTFTLFRRLIRREKWYQAHRSYVYQRMTDLGMTHGKVIDYVLAPILGWCHGPNHL